ncbi:MAG TPA: hypothetical protein VJ994_10370 [Paracoccaceae bacterium]|nr:hypothetical protein [Paracoccaceae bacterium]
MTPAEALVLIGLAGAAAAAGAAAGVLSGGGDASAPRPVRVEDERDPRRPGGR